MRILLDGMGGDYSPVEVVKGAIKAAEEIKETIAIIGPEKEIARLLKKNSCKADNIEIINATEVITNCDAPAMAIKRKKDSTIVKGMRMLKDGEGDAFISAGSTGALLSGGLLILGRIRGIKRPAIAAWVPKIGKSGTTLLLDCGANVDSKPEYILQNGIMGSMFVQGVKGINDPSVGLLNIGAEPEKGDELHKQAYDKLLNSSVNFAGNVEGRDVITTDLDVIATDGFSGNIFIKSSEGVALAIMGRIKEKMTDGLAAKAGALLSYTKLKEVKKEFNYSEAGAAPILGLKAPVLKLHGNSKARDFYYAIIQAVPYVEKQVTEMITDAVNKNKKWF
ncbi:MAG TPA: phosphate acyltransferase PlsX [Mogibacterium sp.]|nr:phosphate acyltransferase PlsX [Mogibacterium sp.]